MSYNVPIWIGEKQKKESEAAEARALSNSFKLQHMRNVIAKGLKILLEQIKIIDKRIDLYEEKMLPCAQKICTLHQSNNKKMSKIIKSVIRQQKAKINYEKARVEREILLAKLERILGTPLEKVAVS